MRVGRCLVLATLVFLLAISTQVAAQSSMDSRVQKLEETIQVLERRVASLEAQLRERTVPTGATSGKVSWRKLQIGMAESDVEQLLGSPSRVDANEVSIVWHYSGSGYVYFDGKARTVKRWSEPL